MEDTIASETVVDNSLHFSSSSEAINYMKESDDWSKYKSGILPQMALDELSYAERLLNSDYKYFIIVDKAKMKVFLYDKFGRIQRKYGMACAKNYGTKHKRGDSRTSEGFFSAEGIYNSTEWLYTDDNGETSPVKGQFGPKFIRVKIPNTRAIGIHGTSAPWSIGGRRSHGCIRLNNDDILELVTFAEVGMPIIISPGPRDMAVNRDEGYYIPSVATVPGDVRAVASKYEYKPQKATNEEAPADSAAVQRSDIDKDYQQIPVDSI